MTAAGSMLQFIRLSEQDSEAIHCDKIKEEHNMKKLGFGLMRLPVLSADPTDFDYAQLEQMVDLFLKSGFTYFDTSYVYHNGASERAIRKVLVERYDRNSYTLASKLPAFAITKEEQMEPIFAEQLDKCGVMYFDYYLLHNLNKILYNGLDGKGGYVKTCHMFEHMKGWKESGKIRHIGFSYHDDAETLDLILTEHPEVEFVQIAFNYYDYNSQLVQAGKCYDVIRKHGRQVIVMEPVKGGMLAKVPEKIEKAMKAVNPDMTPSSWAVRYTADFDGVMMVLSGMSTLGQVQDNVSYMKDFQPLTESDKTILDEAVREYRNTWPIQIPEEELRGVMLHGVPFSAVLESYNTCQIQTDPGFTCDNNYLKGQLAKAGLDINGNLPREKVVLNSGKDITELAAEVEKWMIDHTF